jgi:uncharacterized protein
VQWVIKATKLCNLRCKYCYEWDSLSDPSRMSIDVWRSTLRAVVDYAGLAEQQSGLPIVSDLIWHGGEPLLLSPEYFRGVLALQREVLPEGWLALGRVRNCIQTNLYSVKDEHLDILAEHGFKVGVSFDVVGGVRVTLGGQGTEERVRENLLRLEARGIPYQLIAVFAHHTASDVEALLREIQRIGVPTNLLSLFEGPASRDMRNVQLSRSFMHDAMLRLFERWFDAGMAPRIRPFNEAVEAIVMKRLALERGQIDRRILGNEVLVVDRDGSLSSAAQRDSWALGNLVEAPIGAILSSARYRDQVADEAELKQRVCGPCPFLGGCDTAPITSNFDSFIVRDCVIERPFFTAVEAFLEARGYLGDEFLQGARATVADYVQTVLGAPPPGQPSASPARLQAAPMT